MVLGCMILHHHSVSSLTKSLLLRTIFTEDEIEIEVLDQTTTVAYLWDVQKEKVWQATMDLESASITTFYSFGKTKEEVFQDAYEHLTPLHSV